MGALGHGGMGVVSARFYRVMINKKTRQDMPGSISWYKDDSGFT